MTTTEATKPETRPGTVLEVRGLGHSYGGPQIFEGLDFTVGKGEFVCIVGPSGVGKSTLLQCLT